MTTFGDFSLVAGAMQMTVPSYGLRLVRKFGASRVGWFLVTAFASLALLNLIGSFAPGGTSAGSGMTLQVVYIIGSVLLLIGMGHVETLFSEREHARSSEENLRDQWETQFVTETADLVRTNDELRREIARLEEIQKALVETEGQYRFLFTENPQPMWIVDLRSGRFLTVNNAALRQHGFTAEEFNTLTVQDLLPLGVAPGFLQDFAQPCPKAESRGRWQHLRKDLTLVEVEVVALDIMLGDVPARLVLASDMTRRQKEELTLRRSEKMEAIAQVAGEVANHFGHIFANIEHDTSSLLQQPRDFDTAERLNRIGEVAMRASGHTRQLLAISGRHPVQLESLDVNGLIQHMEPVLRRLVGEYVVFEKTLGSYMLPAMADRHLVEHMIINLVLNARHAMPKGGKLNLSTVTIRVNEENTSDPEARTGEFVRLSVRDTGCGMSPEIQARLFEPFASRRDGNRSAGLGLAYVHGAVKQQSGWVEFSTETDVGTEFRIFLPSAPAPVAQPATRVVRGTVMIVEADDRARELARSSLSRQGYRVIEADSGSIALVLWKGQAANVDLLLASSELKGDITGRDLVTQLRRARPNLKVIYASTRSSATEAAGFESLSNLSFMSKPYRPAVLLQTVQTALEQDARE
jgi:two-component system, cell cycle sensor histidine kinase and response regulator CckA